MMSSDELLKACTRDHAGMMAVMASRLTTFSVINRLAAKGDVTSAIDALSLVQKDDAMLVATLEVRQFVVFLSMRVEHDFN